MTILKENLDYMDMKDQLEDKVTVDEYAAKLGKDKDIVTLTFTTNSKLAAKDLSSWFERGYDFVLDASVSDGELEPGKWLVFVEMKRRSKVPERIVQLLSDLETLTDIKLNDWIVEVEGDEHKPDVQTLRKVIICNPNEYKDRKEAEENSDKQLKEFRQLAGLDVESNYVEDEEIRNLKNIAGL